MGILDDVVVNAKSAVGVVSKKAGQIVDSSKLKLNMADVNSEISKRYHSLGQYMYENCPELLKSDENASEIMAIIDGLKEQYATLEREYADKQNKIICPECSNKVDVASLFCNKCGTKLGG